MVAVMPHRQPTDKPPHPLRQWRDREGLSQDQFAEMTGITQGAISHIERYFRFPRAKMLKVLVEHTGLPPEAFFFPERFLEENPDFFHAPRAKSRTRRARRSKSRGEDTAR